MEHFFLKSSDSNHSHLHNNPLYKHQPPINPDPATKIFSEAIMGKFRDVQIQIWSNR